MSTPQRTHARAFTVDRKTADILRAEAKKILVFNHERFEDLLEFGCAAQHALAMRFQDAIDLITVVGWDPNTVDPDTTTFEIHLTGDLVEQLHERRCDLAYTNLDLLPDDSAPITPDVLAEITVNRLAAGTLYGLIRRYGKAVTQG